MVKRNPRTVPGSGTAQPEPAPAAAMVEPAAFPPVAEPAPAVAERAPLAEPAAAPVQAGAWPDASSAPSGPRCPWCSAPLPSVDLATCPACAAQLNTAAEAEVPGVTTIDVAALAWKAGGPPRRGRILAWISGENDDQPDSSGASASAVEPPSLAVRREILRLELEAAGISLPHAAERSAAEETAAVAEAGPGDAEPGPTGA
jgi:hypothetical protein